MTNNKAQDHLGDADRSSRGCEFEEGFSRAHHCVTNANNCRFNVDNRTANELDLCFAVKSENSDLGSHKAPSNMTCEVLRSETTQNLLMPDTLKVAGDCNLMVIIHCISGLGHPFPTRDAYR